MISCVQARAKNSRFKICLVLMTAIGLLEAITLAFSIAAAGAWHENDSYLLPA